MPENEAQQWMAAHSTTADLKRENSELRKQLETKTKQFEFSRDYAVKSCAERDEARKQLEAARRIPGCPEGWKVIEISDKPFSWDRPNHRLCLLEPIQCKWMQDGVCQSPECICVEPIPQEAASPAGAAFSDRERLEYLLDQLSPSMFADHGIANLRKVAAAMRAVHSGQQCDAGVREINFALHSRAVLERVGAADRVKE